MFEIEKLTDGVREVVAGLDAATFDGRDAARLTEVYAELERLAAAGKVLMARRAVESNGWRSRDAVSVLPEDWFAKVSGCSTWQARDALKTAERLDECPATAEKVRDGSLSLGQASVVSKAAVVDPDAESRLLRTAERRELRTLKEESERVVVAASDEDTLRDRARRERHLRTWTVGMATHGTFSGPTEDIAVLLEQIKPRADAAYHQARDTKDPDEYEPMTAYAFDGLMAFARGARTDNSPPATRIRVDLSALLRGQTEPGEVCEIPGVGPVCVDHARRVLPHGLLELVITDGVDVQTVVSTTRHVPTALKIAIDERDQRCKIRGCDATHDLERHHTLEFAAGKLTTYEILGKLCRPHHDLVTHRGYTIEAHPDGTWTLQPPADHADHADRYTDAA